MATKKIHRSRPQSQARTAPAPFPTVKSEATDLPLPVMDFADRYDLTHLAGARMHAVVCMAVQILEGGSEREVGYVIEALALARDHWEQVGDNIRDALTEMQHSQRLASDRAQLATRDLAQLTAR